MRVFPACSAAVAFASHAEAQAPPANPATLAWSIARRFIVRSPVQSRLFLMFQLPLRGAHAQAPPQSWSIGRLPSKSDRSQSNVFPARQG